MNNFDWWIIIWIYMLMNYYTNAYVWLIWCCMLINDELWDYDVESSLLFLSSLSLMSSMSLKLYVVVESMHTHIKLGSSCLVECLIIHTTLILRAYALHVDLRAYALHVDFKSRCSTRWIESLCSNTLIGTTCILHSQVVVMSLHCRVVVVVELLSCCRCFNVKQK